MLPYAMKISDDNVSMFVITTLTSNWYLLLQRVSLMDKSSLASMAQCFFAFPFSFLIVWKSRSILLCCSMSGVYYFSYESEIATGFVQIH